jgi:NAD(P)-dependent dehydrogenase (short-subunit alcohol dehydrogenase family)
VTKQAIILGAGSDIGRGIADRLQRDGWGVARLWHNQGLDRTTPPRWDLVVCCYGTLEPIGPFWDVGDAEWCRAFEVNLHLPLRQVRELYPRANPGASVCFFSGAGANGPAPTYLAYCVSKIALVKAVECLDAESEDCKFFILGPGMMRTKIQRQTLAVGERAANYRRVADFMASESAGTSPDDVYACLMACVAAPKAAVGGRNIYVPLDDWGDLGALAAHPHAFKLRRDSDEDFRRTEDNR